MSVASGNIIARAIVKDAVFYGKNGDCRCAPQGEYEIEHHDGAVGFCNCSDKGAFTISLDTFMQHLHEGRIALVQRQAA
jgi:hypothetical protein